MPIECGGCGAAGSVIRFRRPALDRSLVQQFWILLALAAAVSAYSAYQFLTTVVEIRGTIQAFVEFIIANPSLQQPALRDGVRMAWNAANLLGAFAVIAMVFIPLRYTWLAFRIHRGHPHTLRQIQITASLSVVFELSRAAALWFIALHNELIHFTANWSFSFVLALALLWYARLGPVRDFFSSYRVHAANEPSVAPEPAPASAG